MANINSKNKLPATFGDAIERRSGGVFGSNVLSDNVFRQDWKDNLHGLTQLLPHDLHVNNWRLYIVFLVIFVCGFGLIGRLFQLQVAQGQEYFVLSERNRRYVKGVEPERGVMYDRNGVVLARNVPASSVGLVYSEVDTERIPQLKDFLVETLDFTSEEIDTVLEVAQYQPFQQTLLKKNITQEQRTIIQTRESEFTGLHVTHDSVRSYPEKEVVSAVIGYTGAISEDRLQQSEHPYVYGSYVGQTGLERQYEEVLRGTPGRTIVEVDAQGKSYREMEVEQPQAGRDVYLTIDVELQKKLNEIMLRKTEEIDAFAGSAVISDVKTGEVLAMVSVPSYDNNVFIHDQAKIGEVLTDERSLLINRAVQGVYAPGSTIKMAIGAWALEKHAITKTTRISGKPQVIEINGFTFPDWTHSWGRAAHGMMTVSDAIAVSSDIFFYKVGGGFPPQCKVENIRCDIDGLGVSGVVEALQRFGFGQSTGIDYPEESVGLVPDPAWKEQQRGEAWFLGNTYHLSIGQGDLLASPVQVLHLSNIVASDAQTPQLHVIKDEGLVKEYDLDGRFDKPVSLESLAAAREGMVKAVSSDGIVFPLRNAPVEVAAKTGTAEYGTLNAEGEYATHAWVTGYAPVQNPEISFVYMFESGGKSEYAAQAAREFIDWYYKGRFESEQPQDLEEAPQDEVADE